MPNLNSFRINLAAVLLASVVSRAPAAPETAGPPAPSGPLMWEESYPIASRYYQSLAVNPVTKRVVMFGGGYGQFGPGSTIASAVFGDLWEWDGKAWHAIQAAGPAPRARAAIGFNPETAEMLLFGGRGAPVDPSQQFANARSDTWAWKEGRWDQRQAEGPLNDAIWNDCSMSYDPVRKRMVLRINSLGVIASSTWEWDGTAWHTRQTDADFTVYSRIAFDAQTGRIIAIHAGPNEPPQNTIEWDGSAWVPAAAAEPAWQFVDAVVPDDVGGRVYAVATTTGTTRGLWQRQNGVWVRLRDVGSPPVTSGGTRAFAWDPVNDTLMAIGSIPTISASLHATYLLEGAAWRLANPTGPGPRVRPTVTHDPVRGVTVVYGSGISRNPIDIPTSSRNDTWEYNGTTWSLKSTNQQPVPSSGPTPMFFDPASERVVAPVLSDVTGKTWEWDGVSWNQRATNTPPPRRFLWSGAYHAGIGKFVAFGGRTPSGQPALTNSTWLLDGATWSELTIPGPSLRESALMCYDEQRQKIVLFGGLRTNEITTITETWEFDGTSWSQVAPSGGPPQFIAGTDTPAYYEGMSYDSARQRTLLIQGPVLAGATGAGITPPFPSSARSVIWEWDGVTWTSNNPVQPVRPVGLNKPSVSFFNAPPPALNFLARRFCMSPGFTTNTRLEFDPLTQHFLLWGGENLAVDSFNGPISVAPASLRHLPASTIIAQPPTDLIAVAGRAFSIEARIAMKNATYQWTRNGAPVTPSPSIYGDTTEALILSLPTPSDAGEYRLTATAPSGETLTTLPCIVRVRSQADFNDDGRVDTKDLMRFLTAFGRTNLQCRNRVHDLATGCLEDFNNDGVVDTRDLVRLLGQFGAAPSN